MPLERLRDAALSSLLVESARRRRAKLQARSREAIEAYRARWRVVAAHERDELRAAAPEAKLHQLWSLMQSVDVMGWHDALDDDGPVRERWRRLRARCGLRP